jgi:hypothetical protein
VYRVEIDVEAQPEVDALPPAAAVAFLELRVVLETSPHTIGRPVRNTPTANMRSVAFGAGDRGLALWYTVEAERRVEVVRVAWLP